MPRTVVRRLVSSLWHTWSDRDGAHGRRRREGRSRRPWVEILEDRTVLSTFYVAPTGSDANAGTSPGAPFRTVQKGITQAAAVSDGNDVVNVAAGTYATAGTDLALTIPNNAGLTSLQLLGGWNAGFTTRAPSATPTVYIPQNPGVGGTADVTVSKAATIDGFTFVFDGTPGSGGSRASGGILAAVSGLTLNQNYIEIGQGTSASLRSTGLVVSSAATINLLTVQNNTFDGDSHTNTIAVQLDGTGTLSGASLKNNLFRNTTYGLLVGPQAVNQTNSVTATVAFNAFTGTGLANIFRAPTGGAGTSAIDVSGNWWGTAIGPNPTDPTAPAAIDASLVAGGTAAGSVSASSFLNSSANAATGFGFTPAVATELWVPKGKAASGLVNVDGKIQSGINTALAGMTVRVAADNYPERLTVAKTLTLVGAAGGATVVQPTAAYNSNQPYDVSVAAVNVTVDGFTFVFDGTPGFGGTRASDGVGVGNGGAATGFVFKNNTVEVGASFGGELPGKSAGLVTSGSTSKLQVTNNTFTADGFNNPDPGTFADASHAIFLNPDTGRTSAAAAVTISGNTITGSRLASAIVIDTQGFVTITNNTISRTLAGNSSFDLVGLRARSVAGAMTNVTITGNTLDNNNRPGSSAVQLADRGGTQPISGVTITNNLIVNSTAGLLVGPNPGDGTQAQTIAAAFTTNALAGNTANVATTNPAGATSISAAGNWWGTAVGPDPTDATAPAAIDASIQATAGQVAVGSFLNSGANAAAGTGFTPAAGTEMWVPKAAAGTSVRGVIQAGITAATAGMTVRVAADTYIENVTVTKTVELAGAGQGLTVLLPALSAPMPGASGSLPAGASNLILVQANNVQIHDLTLDGDNPTLATGFNAGGANVDARNGIITNHNAGVFTNLQVHHTTVRNIYLRGIYASTSGGTFNFHDNTVTNVQGEAASIGIFAFGESGTVANNAVSYATDAIAANHSRGIQFLNNVVSHSGSGIHTDNAGDGGGPGDLIQGNTVTSGTAGSYGIWTFVPYKTIVVQNNVVAGVGVGLSAFGGAGGASSFVGNSVAVNAGGLGVLVSTDQLGFQTGSVAAAFTGNTVAGGATGLYMEEPRDPATPTSTATLTLTANAFTGASAAGIELIGGTATVGQNTVTGNGIGILLEGGTLTSVTQNFLSNNAGDGLKVTSRTGPFLFYGIYYGTPGATATTTGVTAAVFDNDLSGNGGWAVTNTTAAAVNAAGNWWGVNTPAGVAARVAGNVAVAPWLGTGTDTAPATAGFQGDFSPLITSADHATFQVGAAGPAFTVTTAGYPAPTLTIPAGSLPAGVTFTDNGNGTATLAGTPAAGTGGVYAFTITAHNGAGADAAQPFTLTVNQSPAITSTAAATFVAGSAGSFQVTATGFPAPTFSAAGTLPAGVTLDSTGLLAGTPAVGSGGTYTFTVTATNGVAPDAVQGFTLTVNEAPTITSAAATTFTVGTAGSFSVTASGFPAPTLSESPGDVLPAGVSFNAATGVLGGTPAAGTGGIYTLHFTAHNGVGADAVQIFTLTVLQTPAFSSAAAATFVAGSAGSFQVTATGFPAPTFSAAGTLPAGVTLESTGLLAGTPAVGSGGVYTFTVTATNGVAPDAVQGFTLTVNEAPTITSATAATFTAGTAGSFSVTASGFPAPTLSESPGDVLPAGVSFNAVTGVLGGTPAAGTGGIYTLHFTAHNGVGADAAQTFTLTVLQAPAFSSAAVATFAVGSAGSFLVTTTGFPAASLTRTGSLPAGVTFTDNGNGTATLAGTPLVGSDGTFTVTFQAANAVATVTQSFTLTVLPLPAGSALVVADPCFPTQNALVITGTALDDHIQVKPGAAGQVQVTIDNATLHLVQTFNTASLVRLIVYGLAGDDHIEVHGKITLPAVLFGGAGDDHLQAGGGATVLHGGAGNDHLEGGDGNDVLIGALGSDHLEAKKGNDILIGGTTDYDANLKALCAILDTWKTTTDATFAAQVALLKTGPYALTAATVHDDGFADQLDAGQALDWFFVSVLDKITGKKNGDAVTTV